MPLFRTQAIVLRSFNLSETDKLITFMTESYGKIKCVAKGSRRIKSKFGGTLEPLSHVSLIYFGRENLSLFRLNQCDIIQSFQDIREDSQKYYTAVYFNELLDSMAAEAQVDRNLFELLLQALQETRQGDNLETLRRLVELRVLSLSGYQPRLENCLRCKKIPESYSVGFSYNKQGILCESCMSQEAVEIRIKGGSLNYLKKLLTLDIRHTGRLKIPNGSETEIENVTHRLILSRLGRELKSYPFIKQMANLV